MNIWNFLKSNFMNYESLPALTSSNGDTITYGELVHAVEDRSKALRQLMPYGRKVAVLHHNSFDQGLQILAGIAAGFVVIPLSLHYGANRCKFILKDSMPDFLLCDVDLSLDLANYVETLGIRPITLDLFDNVEMLKIAAEVIDHVNGTEEEFLHSDAAFIMYTSGTTGRPRGVVLSHGNVNANLKDIKKYFYINSEDHMLIVRSLSHASALTGEFLYGLLSGCRISFYSEAFSPVRLSIFIREQACTVFCATPTMVYQMSLMSRNNQLDTLKQVVLSGECLNKAVIEKVRVTFPSTQFFNVYGLTEASPRISYLAPEHFTSKSGSVGVPLQSVKIRVIRENGELASPGEIGELIVQGPNVMIGYFNRPKETSERVRHGWLYTGDAAYLDNDGFLYIVGRKDDMIIRGGVNIYPIEIEQVIQQHPLVHEVVANGIIDPIYGNRIHVTLTGDPQLKVEEISLLCKRELEAFQRPDKIIIVDKLDLNATGKALRIPQRMSKILTDGVKE